SGSGAFASRKWYTSVSSTPGNRPEGSGPRICACETALGQDACCQRWLSASSGSRQQLSSGQVEAARRLVSRPRKCLACANGTPRVMENSPESVAPVCVERQKVLFGVSVYWWSSGVRVRRAYAALADQCRHTGCPSIAPVTSAVNVPPSFS